MALLLLCQAWIGDVATASCACGVLGVGGNKGAVAVSFSLHRHNISMVCSHFAAHQARGPFPLTVFCGSHVCGAS